MIASNIDMRDAFFDQVYDLAAQNKNILFLTADHGAFSLVRFKKDFPQQYLNVGISEQNMISVAAGLALSGKTVFVYSIVNFVTLRCFEQIAIDVSGMNLSVNIVGVGAGFTYSVDGPTHHGMQDVAAMASMPNLQIFNASDPTNTSAFADIACSQPGPKYIRIEKGTLPQLYMQPHDFSDGLAQLKSGNAGTIIATGIMVPRAMAIAEKLSLQHQLEFQVVDLYRLKPINAEKLLSYLERAPLIVTLEENWQAGGMGSMVSTLLSDHRQFIPLSRIALPEKPCFEYADREWMQTHFGLGEGQIMSKILNFAQENSK